MTLHLTRRESDAAYSQIVAQLNDRWRVIVCKDGIQWILQQRRGERRGTARFDGRSYSRIRDGLLRVCREFAGEIGPEATNILRGLPRMIDLEVRDEQ